MTDETLITYECRDRVALISFNKPQVLNAFDDAMVRELMAAMHRFDGDDEAFTAIIYGQGRAFCSGADVRKRQALSKEELKQKGGPAAADAKNTEVFVRSLHWKPVIAAVHGYVLGLGIGLALDCDLVVAEAGTKFQITETARGLGGAPKYMDTMAYRGAGAFATKAALTGRYFTAEEALAAGVIDEVAPLGKHLEFAHALARDINKNPPLAVREVVRLRRWQLDDLRRQATRYDSLTKLYLTEDFQESTRAFIEKRPPHFSNR